MNATVKPALWNKYNGRREAVPVALVGDDSSKDAFGRLRVANLNTIFDSKNIHTLHNDVWLSDISGGGSSITHLSDEAAVQLEAGTGATDYVVRQTGPYWPYTPGHSRLVTMTGVLGAQKANVDTRIGYFDDDDGLFFEMSGALGPILVRRTSVSGSVANAFVPQFETAEGAGDGWNRDTLGGEGGASNPSGITVDFTKTQIFMIDFQWLGVGRVRYYLDIDGIAVCIHEMNHANSLEEVYMATPTLPIRYEVRNTAATASATSLKEICSAVATEGDLTASGTEFHEGNGATFRVAASGVATPVFAIRLSNAFGNKATNRIIARIIHARFYSTLKDTYFELFHVHSPSVTDPGAGGWLPIGDHSGMEYAPNIISYTTPAEHKIDDGIVVATGNQGDSIPVAVDVRNRHNSIVQNLDSTSSQMFVVKGTGIGGNANVSTSLGWVEIE